MKSTVFWNAIAALALVACTEPEPSADSPDEIGLDDHESDGLDLRRFTVASITPIDASAPPASATLRGTTARGTAVAVTFKPGDATVPVTIAYGGTTRALTLGEAKQLYEVLAAEMLEGRSFAEISERFNKAITFTREAPNPRQIFPLVDRLGLIPGVVSPQRPGDARGLRPQREAYARQHRLTLGAATVNGVRYSYVDSGRGAAGTIVFIPGYPDSWYEWRHALPYFMGRGFRVISLDLPGQGDSEAPADINRYKVASIATDVARLVSDLGVATYDVVGHDWGAPVAWYTAIQNPTAVTHLAVSTTGHPRVFSQFGAPQTDPALALPAMNDADVEKISYMVFLGAAASSAPDDIVQNNDWAFFHWLSRGNRERRNQRVDLARPGALANARKLYTANLADFFGIWSTAANCKVKTLGIFTTGDGEYLRKDNMSAAGRFVEAPGSFTFVEMDSTHWPMLDTPALYNDRIFRFLTDRS